MPRFHGWFAGASLLALAACSSIENRLVFHPSAAPQSPAALAAPWRDVELNTPDGNLVHARWHPLAKSHGAILYCAGNAGNVDTHMPLAQKLSESLGESVLIFDYPGFGKSEGAPAEQGCYAAAQAAYDWLTKAIKIPGDRVVLYGDTFGAAVATELASRCPHRALVLVTPFTSLPDVTDYQLPIFPGHYVLQNRFDNLSRIGRCTRPTFFAHGDRDRVIPIAQAEKLYRACNQEKELCVLRGLGHRDPLPYEFYATLDAFLKQKAPLR
jgi:fermentation-respiration switch protein FrsA (DUF1100 family)